MGFARDFATNCRAQIPLRPQRKFFNCRPKKDLIPRLKREAAKLKGELISISNSSDPYPNLEAKTGLTRKCLEILSRNDCRIQMVTKLKIVARDVDLLRRIPSMVTLTVTTDDDVSKVIEPDASSSSERLKVAEILIGKGIRIVSGLLLMNKNGLKMLQTIRLAQLP